MRTTSLAPVWFLVSSALLVANSSCTKKETVTQPVEVEKSIVGFATYGYGVNVRFVNPYLQRITFTGYDDAKQISATVNGQPMRRRNNFNSLGLTSEYKVTFNQNCVFNVNIDGKAAAVTEIMPDSLFITSHQNGATVSPNQPVTLQWNNPSNTDFYFISARAEQGIVFLLDSTFVTITNQLILPAKFFPTGATTVIDILAVAGLPPYTTSVSNLQGDLRGRFYFYVQTAFFRLRSGSGATPQTGIANSTDTEYVINRFKEFIGFVE